MGTTLVVNPGSSSRKYALFVDGEQVLAWEFERTTDGFASCNKTAAGQKVCASISEAGYQAAVDAVAKDVHQHLEQSGEKTVDMIALRIVAPGTFFQKHRVIDGDYIAQLEQQRDRAPLHIPHILNELHACQRVFANVTLAAVSDSAFHAALPPVAREYSLPEADATAGDIHRFGYHGLSVAAAVRRLPRITTRTSARTIVCHIGNGVSVTAVADGQSVETTMGYSPASGLSMGSRAGDLDAAGLLAVMRHKHLTVADAELYLNTSGGLVGLAGHADIRHLLEGNTRHEPVATKALQFFVYHIQKAIASSTVALQGIDILVFTGTAGVRSSELRSLVCADMTYLGIELEAEKNAAHCSKDGVISTATSAVAVVVQATDEMGEMARIASDIATG